MVQALAPRISRGWLWGWLLVGLLVATPSTLFAQADSPKGAPKGTQGNSPAGAPAAKGQPPVKPEAAEAEPLAEAAASKRETVELFKDPRTEKATANTFPELPLPKPTLSPGDLASVQSMASGQSAPDPTLIRRFVETQASEMTNHNNIRSVIDPPANQAIKAASARAIEKASQEIINLLNTARANKNAAFLTAYQAALAEKFPPLLSNHLLARIEGSIALAMAANASMSELFAKQINDPNQIVWVKLWAARGLANATEGGKVLLDVVKSTSASASVVGFLEKESDAPWPVKVRMFEALTALRIPSSLGVGGKLNIPNLTLGVVADTEARVDVRAAAASTLGAIVVPDSVAKFNFKLEAYFVGRLAAEIGDRIGAEFDTHESTFAKESDSARYLTGLLLYPVYSALGGDENLRDSGFLRMRHPALTPVMPFIRGLDEQIKNVSQAAMDLINAGGAQTKERRGVLATRVSELKAFLEKNRPDDSALTPDGPKFALPTAQVAGANPRSK